MGHTEAARRCGEQALDLASRYGMGAIRSIAGHALGLLDLELGDSTAIDLLRSTGAFTVERGVRRPCIHRGHRT